MQEGYATISETRIKPLQNGGFFVSRQIMGKIYGFEIKNQEQLIKIIRENNGYFYSLYELAKQIKDYNKELD